MLHGGKHGAVVPEWLAIAQAARLELPAHWLPMALDLLPEKMRHEFADVLGPRAGWLAARNPRWSVRLPEPSEEIWGSGDLQERLRQLSLLRQKDPDRGREWLTQSWPSETPDGRAVLIQAMETGLAAADEPFLEQALDDRRKEVRSVAVRCLLQLPGSAHAARNRQRLDALIRTEGGGSQLVLRVELPAEVDKSAQRDGIDPKRPAGLPVGERTFWLSQMLERTPPQHWTERFSCDPDIFLDALAAGEHGDPLLVALGHATRMCPDPQWCRALCRKLVSGEPAHARARARALTGAIAALPAEEQQPLLAQLFTAQGTMESELLSELFHSAEIRWATASTALVIAFTKRQTSFLGLYRGGMHMFGYRADVAGAQPALAAILETLPAEQPGRQAFEEMTEIIDFRASMRSELLGSG
jgi:hypothetical protein